MITLFRDDFVGVIVKSDFEEPVHFEKVLDFALVDHVVQVGHFLFGHVKDLLLVFYVIRKAAVLQKR